MGGANSGQALYLEFTQSHLPTQSSLLQSNRTVCLSKGLKKSYVQRQRNSGALLHASKFNIKYRRPLTWLRMLGVADFTKYFQPPFRDAVGPHSRTEPPGPCAVSWNHGTPFDK